MDSTNLSKPTNVLLHEFAIQSPDFSEIICKTLLVWHKLVASEKQRDSLSDAQEEEKLHLQTACNTTACDLMVYYRSLFRDAPESDIIRAAIRRLQEDFGEIFLARNLYLNIA